MRPAAGIVGLITHPINGAWKSVQSNFGREQEQQQRSTRIRDGMEAFTAHSATQRSDIIKKFKELKPETKARQKHYAEMAEQELCSRNRRATREATVNQDETQWAGDDSSRSPISQSWSPIQKDVSSSIPPQETWDEEAFLKDLEFAKQLSLAEQQGYERGLSEQLGRP